MLGLCAASYRSPLKYSIVFGLIAGGAAQIYGEAPSPTYLLRYQFTAGTAVSYADHNRSQIEIQQGEAEQHVVHEERATKHYQVVSVDEEGNGLLQLTIDDARLSVAVDGGDPVTFDSRKDKEPPASFLGIAQTIGRPLAQIKAAPTGELLEIEWLVPGQQVLPNKQDAGNLDILMRLPDGAIAVGDQWKERFQTEVMVEEKLRKQITLLRTYKLVSVEEGLATIELKTSIITPLRDPKIESQLIQKAPSGTIVFDVERGVLRSRITDVDQEVVGFNGGKSRIHNVTRHQQHIREDAISTAEEASPPAR